MASTTTSFPLIPRTQLRLLQTRTLKMAASVDGIGIAHLPNQRHKIVAKRGAAFTIMVRPKKPLLKLYMVVQKLASGRFVSGHLVVDHF